MKSKQILNVKTLTHCFCRNLLRENKFKKQNFIEEFFLGIFNLYMKSKQQKNREYYA